MNQPSTEQVTWFWEQCGFRYVRQEELVKNVIMPYGHWIDPEGNSLPDGTMLLEPDLNNLFKYAVPKLGGRYYLEGTGGTHTARAWYNTYQYSEVIGETPALALFWACFKSFGGEP